MEILSHHRNLEQPQRRRLFTVPTTFKQRTRTRTLHSTTIITGYRLALREAVKYMNEKISTKVDALGRDSLVNIA